MSKIIKNSRELAKCLGCDHNVTSIHKVIYKGTSCGAWIAISDDGIEMGSIVEGVDECTEIHELKWGKFTEENMWETLTLIEEEADEIWNATHGCEDCFPSDGFPEGHRPINPECRSCKGQGTII